MIKKAGLLLALCLSLSLCSACQVRNVTKGMEEGEHYDAVIRVKSPDEEADSMSREDQETLQTLYEMPGMTDEEAAGLLGGGEENRTEDGGQLIGRNYTVNLFGESCPFYTSYGQEQQVELAYAILPEGNLETYGALLVQVYGQAEIAVDEEDSPLEYLWQKDGKLVCLYQDESIILDYSLDFGAE